MLEMRFEENTWEPEEIPESEIDDIIAAADDIPDGIDKLIIFKTEPYIDSLLVHYGAGGTDDVRWVIRYTFHEGFRWDSEAEEVFKTNCILNPKCCFSYEKIGQIFRFYSVRHPEWQLQRYYTTTMRMLDHIYICIRRDTVKELLYKAGLDELAVWSDTIDEVNLMAGKPSEIYDGLSNKILRSLNCRVGAELLAQKKYREYIRELKKLYPYMFTKPMNDAQCSYLKYLIDGELTPGEAGRLYRVRSDMLMAMWSRAQYLFFIEMETVGIERIKLKKQVCDIDPIYAQYLENSESRFIDPLGELKYYLITNREKFDARIRRANRKRNPEWQERGKGYVVRYPQTINDYCREAAYMSNCLMGYIEAFVNNDTTILFMRREDDFNHPFISIEIFDGRLVQAYKRFNSNCTAQEALWIIDYCERHGIDRGSFSFGMGRDMLM